MQGFDNSKVEFITIDKAGELVKEVVQQARQAVVATMGPNGRVVAISTGTKPKVTKDGVTVARALKFNDPRKELINKIVTEAPIKTDEECGDGTTTTMLLMAEMFNIYQQFPSYQQQAFIDKLVSMWIKELEGAAIQVDVNDDRLRYMARTSSNNDIKLSDLVVDLYQENPDVFPSIELILGVESEDRVVRSNGLTMSAVYSNQLYAGKNRSGVTYDNYIPVILDDYVRGTDPTELYSVLAYLENKVEAALQAGTVKPTVNIVIIARAIETVMDNAILTYNQAIIQQSAGNPHMQFVGCRMEGAGGSIGSMIMQDAAIMLGCQMYASLNQIKSGEPTFCTNPLTINAARSIIVPDEEAQMRIDERVKELRESLLTYDARTRFSRRARFDENRIRNMTGELITVWVGGETESDVKERKDRFEDVVKAVKSALVNGIVPGVGTTLISTMNIVASLVENDDHTTFPGEWRAIVGGLVHVAAQQNEILMKGIFSDENLQNDVLDLATGRRGQPEDLGIFDTAYSSITALKGGAQTAKILANMSSILISNKLDSHSLEG